MKRNNGRPFQRPNQRQEMDSDLAKVNVQQASVGLAQDALQRAQLPARNLPRCVTQLPEPQTSQEMRRRLGNDVDWLKWITCGLFALLGNHHRNASLQGCDLPVDM